MGSAISELAEVEREIRGALAARPDHPGLLAALGGVRLQQGDTAAAVDLLGRAARLAPGEAPIWADYGGALTAAGRLQEAEGALRSALAACGPDDNLFFNLARCLQLAGRFPEALEVLKELRQEGDDVYKLRGDLQKELGDWRGAMHSYMQALQLAPANPAYLNDLGVMLELHGNPADHRQLWAQLAMAPDAHGVVFFFLGNALRAEGSLEAAKAAYERAVALEPAMAEAHNNLALVLGALGQAEAARAAFAEAVRINPDMVAAQTNLGAILSQHNALDEAEAMLSRAVRLDPGCIDARCNYGALLMRQRRYAEAEAELRQVLAMVPGQASAELNLGLLQLTRGNFAEGWPYYESRWKMPQLAEKRPALATPAWTGEPLDGRHLFVFSEQGFGDNIQFVRYLREVKRRFPTARLTYYALHSLTDLIRASLAPEECAVLRWGDPVPPHDCHAGLLSLPWRCATTPETVPLGIPYLRPPAEQAARWRERLAALPGPRVGLVWATAESFIYRSAKTIPLERLRPLVEAAPVTWVNLQFGKEKEEIAAAGLAGRFFDAMGQARDFSDTAAIVDALDLVISVDTAVAHLAGALGRPVWMLDRFDTDWRWLPPREDSPWYPTLRVFRQERFGDWTPVVERAAAALAAWAAS